MALDFNFNIDPGTDIPTSQATLAIRRKLAATLLQQGTDTAPVTAWSQGAARVMQGLLGGYDLRQADVKEAAARKQAIEDWTAGVNASGAAPQPSPGVASTLASLAPAGAPAGAPPPARSPSPMPPAPVGPMPQVRQAMEGIEPVPQDAYAQDTFRTPLDAMRPPRDAMVAALTGSAPTPAAPPPMPAAENVPAMPVAPPAASPAPSAPPQGGNRPIDPRLMRALGNEFLPQGMAQLASGQIGRQLAPPDFKQIGQSVLGQPEYGWVNAENQTVKPINIAGGASGGANPQNDVSFQKISDLAAKGATPDQLYQYVPTELREAVKSVVDGRGVPQSIGNRGAARTAVMLYAHAVDPTFDEALLPQRMTFARSMGSTAPTSVGGQKLLLGTSLGHLAELADSAVGVDNSSGMGIAPLAHGVNAIRNLGTEQSGKVLNLEDKAQKFAGEVGKLYSGSSGGGVHEREDTRARFRGTLSPPEMAGALEASRDLIQSKIDALDNQRDQVYGAQGRTRVEFVDATAKANLAKIDAAIAKLRSGSAAPAATSAAPITKTIGDKTYIKQNGQWFQQ